MYLKAISSFRKKRSPGTLNSYWMVTAVVDEDYGQDKFAIMSALKARNIDSRPFFSPLSTLKAFEGREASRRYVRPEAAGARVSRTGVNLPSGYNMTEQRVDLVSRALREVLGADA